MTVACLECGYPAEHPVRGRHPACWARVSRERHGQTSDWRRVSAAFRRTNPSCFVCGKESGTTVHHRDGDHSNNDWSNLVTLCAEHHGAEEAARLRVRRA